VITYINSNFVTGTATLQKNSVSVSAFSTGTPTATQTIVPGETLTYTSSASVLSTWDNTPTNLFGIKAYDGNTGTLASEIRVNITPRTGTGQNPTFSYSAPIPLPTNGAALSSSVYYEISYATLRNYLDAYDIDDTGRTTMTFMVTGGGSATLASGVTAISLKNGANACGTSPTTITNASTTIGSGQTICVQLTATSVTSLTTTTTFNSVATYTNTVPILNIQAVNVGTGTTQAVYIPVLVRYAP
jgi:hypothetical protein